MDLSRSKENSKYINYRCDPKLFSNALIISDRLIAELAPKIQYETIITARDILKLAVFVEAVVLSSKIIIVPSYGFIPSTGDPGYYDFDDSGYDWIDSLMMNNITEKNNIGTVTNRLASEVLALQVPEKNTRIHFLHDSHIVFETLDHHDPGDDFEIESWEDLSQHPSKYAYINAIKKFGLDVNSHNHHWQLLANCHGIPYCSNVFYTLKNVTSSTPTNIGFDLYLRLQELHQGYFQKIRNYLGVTYVNLPPLLSIVLDKCRNPNDILNQTIQTRDQFYKFRESCTNLEIELRQAEKLEDQIAIINAIENHYNSLTIKIAKSKSKILFKMYDIVKQANPIQMGLSVVDFAKEYDIEQDSVIKLTGYYDLWRASLEVKQSLSLLEKVFGDKLSPNIIQELNDFEQIIA